MLASRAALLLAKMPRQNFMVALGVIMGPTSGTPKYESSQATALLLVVGTWHFPIG